VLDLFSPGVRRTTWLVIAVCALGLTGHWAFMFWNQIQFKNLPDVIALTGREKGDWGRAILNLVIVSSIAGNFVAAWFAQRFGGFGEFDVVLGVVTDPPRQSFRPLEAASAAAGARSVRA